MDRLIFLPFSINGQKRRNKKKGDIQYSLPKEAGKKKEEGKERRPSIQLAKRSRREKTQNINKILIQK